MFMYRSTLNINTNLNNNISQYNITPAPPSLADVPNAWHGCRLTNLNMLYECCPFDLSDGEKAFCGRVQLFSRYGGTSQKRPRSFILHITAHGSAFRPFARLDVTLHGLQVRRHLNEHFNAIRIGHAHHVVLVRLHRQFIAVKAVEHETIRRQTN